MTETAAPEVVEEKKYNGVIEFENTIKGVGSLDDPPL